MCELTLKIITQVICFYRKTKKICQTTYINESSTYSITNSQIKFKKTDARKYYTAQQSKFVNKNNKLEVLM